MKKHKVFILGVTLLLMLSSIAASVAVDRIRRSNRRQALYEISKILSSSLSVEQKKVQVREQGRIFQTNQPIMPIFSFTTASANDYDCVELLQRDGPPKTVCAGVEYNQDLSDSSLCYFDRYWRTVCGSEDARNDVERDVYVPYNPWFDD